MEVGVKRTGNGYGRPVLKKALGAAQTQVRSQKSFWGWESCSEGQRAG